MKLLPLKYCSWKIISNSLKLISKTFTNDSSNDLTFAYCGKHKRLGFRQADCAASWDKSEFWKKNWGIRLQLVLLSRSNTRELKDYPQRKSCYQFFNRLQNLILKLYLLLKGNRLFLIYNIIHFAIWKGDLNFKIQNTLDSKGYFSGTDSYRKQTEWIGSIIL